MTMGASRRRTEGDIAVKVTPMRPAGLFKSIGAIQKRRRIVSGEWYITGDRAIRDEDGYFWFVGRADDVIISAGYRIGPLEVECAGRASVCRRGGGGQP